MHLTKAEEQLMNIIWDKGNAFFKDILESYPEPKPANTTVATLLKRVQDKGFIEYTLYGNSREYRPLIGKGSYYSKNVREMVKDYFDDSPLQFASFFTRSSNMTAEELEDLKKIVEQEINKKQK